jgi:hypothetical protein
MNSRTAAPERTAGEHTVGRRIALRWPGLMHLTAASVLRLPRGSRLRRSLLEHAAQGAYEAWNSDDFRELASAAADPEIEDVVEVARDKVLVTGRHIGEGLASGVEIERWGAIIYTFRRGKILRVDAALFSDRDSVSELVRSIAENEH